VDDLIGQWAENDLPPVDQWHPSESRTIDMRIASDGQWYYLGSPIRRERLVQLFSRVLRMESDGTSWLVTPGEKLQIQVDDAHFQALLVDVQSPGDDQALVFTTNVGERVVCDAEHRIDVQYADGDDTPAPYLQVRSGLTARITRSVFIELANLSEVREGVAGVVSCGEFMPLGPVE